MLLTDLSHQKCPPAANASFGVSIARTTLSNCRRSDRPPQIQFDDIRGAIAHEPCNVAKRFRTLHGNVDARARSGADFFLRSGTDGPVEVVDVDAPPSGGMKSPPMQAVCSFVYVVRGKMGTLGLARGPIFSPISPSYLTAFAPPLTHIPVNPSPPARLCVVCTPVHDVTLTANVNTITIAETQTRRPRTSR